MSPISCLVGRVRALVLACVAAVAVPAGEVHADEAPAAATEDIVVVGSRLRRTHASEDPTASATIVEADRFAGEAKGVADLVATAPGVAVNGYGGLGQLATASIRGSTASGVLVLLDGIPLNTGLGGGVDLSSIPRAWIDRIEVVRGPEGAQYGSGSLGGVVNVITRRAPAGTWSGETSAASFETLAASAEGAARAGAASIFLAGSGETTSGAFPYVWESTPDDPSGPARHAGTRTWNGASRAGGMAKLTSPVGGGRLDAVAQVSAGRRELPGWPYDLTSGDWQEDARALLSARLSAKVPSPDLLLSARTSARLDLLATELGGEATRQRGGAAGIEGEARLFHASGVLRLSAGAEGEAFRGTGLDGTVSRATFSATAAEDLELGGERARLSPAVRVERVGSFGGVSGKLGASARLAGPLAVRASAGRTFRVPSFSELYLQQGLADPNPDLVPEEGAGGDAAVVLESGAVYASVGGHATLYRDLIYWQRASLGRLKPFNAGKALIEGFEVEVATAPRREFLGLALSASYTLLSTEILRGVQGTLGNEVPHRARHRLYTRAAIAPGPASLHVELHYVGRQYADDQNLGAIPAALVWNAGGSVRIRRSPSLHLSVEVRNVLDDRNQQDGFGNPLPGRMVLVAVRAASPPTEGTP